MYADLKGNGFQGRIITLFPGSPLFSIDRFCGFPEAETILSMPHALIRMWQPHKFLRALSPVACRRLGRGPVLKTVLLRDEEKELN